MKLSLISRHWWERCCFLALMFSIWNVRRQARPPSGTSSNRGKPAHSRFCPNRREQNELLARASFAKSCKHRLVGDFSFSPQVASRTPRLTDPVSAVLYWTTFHRLSRGGAWMARQFITSAVPSILYRLRAKNRAGRKSPDRAGQFILRHRTAPTAGPKLGRLQIDRGPTLRRNSCRFRLACWSWKNSFVGKKEFNLRFYCILWQCFILEKYHQRLR